MGTTRTTLDDLTTRFIQAQPMFFVATAPLDPQGHVNLSPKGLDTFRILGAATVAYLDLTGSGIETVAHLKENGRIVLMFCAFQGPPNIMRLYGRGRVVEPQDVEFEKLAAHFAEYESKRSIIVIELREIRDSCGYGVPFMKCEGERPQLSAWAHKKGGQDSRPTGGRKTGRASMVCSALQNRLRMKIRSCGLLQQGSYDELSIGNLHHFVMCLCGCFRPSACAV